MRILSKKALRQFWERHAEAEQPLLAWYREVEAADWETSAQLKERFPSASILRDNRVVFNIGGNRFRLVIWINYRWKAVYVKWLGTHAEYDRIDAGKVEP